MTITLTAGTIITAAAVLAAISAILVAVFKVYNWFKKQDGQEAELQAIRDKHDEDIKAIKEEQTLLVWGILACLKGLKEQGCNGPVTETIDKIEKHLNIEAHR